MTTAFTMTQSVFADVAKIEADTATTRDTNKAAMAAISDRKMDAYSALVCDLLDAKLQKGNLTKTFADEFRAGLMGAGLTNKAGDKLSGNGKRYYDNTVGILRKINGGDLGVPSQATPQAIREALAAENVDNESQLKAWLDEGKAKYLHEHEEIIKQVAGTWTFGKDNKGKPRPTGHKLAKVNGIKNPSIDDVRQQWQDIVNAVEARLDGLAQLEDAANSANTDERAIAALLKEIAG